MSAPSIYTIKEVDKEGWNHPSNESVWWGVVFEEVTEPVKYIVDGDKIKDNPVVGMKLNGWLNQPKEKNYQIFNPADTPVEEAEAKAEKKTSDYQKGLSWGNALNNATQLVINYGEAGMTLDKAVEAVLATARLLDEGHAQNGQETSLELSLEDIEV